MITWAGGKRRLAEWILSYAPENYGVYYEPFFGGGAVAMRLQPKHAVINDLNKHLIGFYRYLAYNDFDSFERDFILFRSVTTNNELTFNRLRSEWNDYLELPMQGRRAMVFLYLITTCYGGKWVENKKTDKLYRFTFGDKIGKNGIMSTNYRSAFYNLAKWQRLRALLRRCDIHNEDYRHVLASAKAGDFVYLDPPYRGTETNYNVKFDYDAYEATFNKLDKRGVYLLSSLNYQHSEHCVQRDYAYSVSSQTGKHHEAVEYLNIGNTLYKELKGAGRVYQQMSLFED